ncbi:hypothetical protein [Raoultella ornithinolytica]|uniref:hypothetical protein n=1 Tax=Raoultella ornithinolytica TaxID=54291 RepID=UPI00384E7F0D
MRKILLAALIVLSGATHAEWKHDVTEDKMGRGSDEVASVVSSNTLSLQPPYDGKQNATFSLRSLRGENNEFVVAIEKGQIICEQDGCGLLVRVDGEKAFRLTGAHPKDGSSDMVVGSINAEDLRKIKKSKSILIELTIYQNGEHVLEFDSKNNPFIGRKNYLISEIREMIDSGTPPKHTKTSEIPMDMPKFDICKKVANKKPEDGKITVIEVNKKDEFTTATYGEDSVMTLACKRGSKTSMLSFFSYD